jgi:hypothetical protein
MKHPLYFGLGLFACLYLALANLRGWSFWQSVSPTRWSSGGSSSHHK